MGTLFPHSDEYPDHKPVPSPLDAAKSVMLPIVLVLLLVLVSELLHPDDHDPHTHIEVVVWHPPDPPPVPFGWQNNSMFEAAHAVIRQRQARRDEQTRVAQMTPMGSPTVLLFGDAPSSTGH